MDEARLEAGRAVQRLLGKSKDHEGTWQWDWQDVDRFERFRWY